MRSIIVRRFPRFFAATAAIFLLAFFLFSGPSPAREAQNAGSKNLPVAGADEDALARLPAEAQESVHSLLIPVLAPRSDAFASQAKVLVLGHGEYYSLKVMTPDYGWILYGGGPPLTDIPEPVPQLAHVRLRGNGGIASVSEGVWNLVWTESGVRYHLTFACEISGVHLCATPDAAVDVMDDLVLVRR